MSKRIVAIAEAERVAGKRLDRRRRYAVIDGEVCSYGEWTEACSGCHEGMEYGGNGRQGSGCHECGYTGKRRTGWWSPIKFEGIDP